MEQERRRRIDRVTSDDYLEGLDTAEVADVRAMRDDCRYEETRLSYARRVLHGQLDIVRAEQQRRRSGEDHEEENPAAMVARLTRVLADEPAPRSREARNAPVYAPDEEHYGHRSHDTLVDDVGLGRVRELSDDDLAGLLRRLEDKEAHISSLRRTVLSHLDTLQDELIGRYRDSAADVADVVASAVAPRPDESS